MRVRWSDQAPRQLLEILDYISQERPVAARRLVSRVRASIRATTRNPRIGRMVPELGTDRVRERIVAPYRVIYQLRADELVVLAVLHERRDLSGADEEDEGAEEADGKT